MQTLPPKSSPPVATVTKTKAAARKAPIINTEPKLTPLTTNPNGTMKIKIEADIEMPRIPIGNSDTFDNIDDDDNDDTLEQTENVGADKLVMPNGLADDSDNSSDMDSFKDSFLRGTSAEEVFDKLKKEEVALNCNQNQKPSTATVKQNIDRIIESFDNDSKMDLDDTDTLFGLPDTGSNMTVVSSETMETENDTMAMCEGLSEHKENLMPVNVNPLKALMKSQRTMKEPFAMNNTVALSSTSTSYLSNQSNKISGPRLLYEIQSQDGFTYKSTSITEIWEKLFETVQIARKAHGLSTLPVGPLADMCGYQMMGLKTNALKYLLEQLPGVEKCMNYKPIYHKRAESTISQTSSSGYWSDCDEIKENSAGTARCERYKGRSEYDMFSWLASRHRRQPIQISAPVHGLEMEILARRGSGSNLPMAMRYRTLKESYKDSVGVYRSHIHGRGLFCNRDIEAGSYFRMFLAFESTFINK